MNNYDMKCKIIEEELRSVWPEWHVGGRLGGGAFGDVFQIYRDNYGIRVDSALKVIQVSNTETTAILPFNRNNNGPAEDNIPDALRSEIQIMEALRGAPNIVTIEDFHFKMEGLTCSLFVRMELLTSLQEILQGRNGQHSLSSIREIVKLGRDVCTALMYCEKKDIIHRDIKPENLFVDRFGDYKVGDFGVSKRMDAVNIARTMTGIGTISYMAPEVFRGHPYNNTVDIYALGLVLYQLLNNGRMPFLPAEASYTARDIDSANYKRLQGTPVPALVGKSFAGEPIGDWLDAAVRKACAVDPADRYQTAKEFYDALSYGKTERKREAEEEREQREEEERKQREKEERMQQMEERSEGDKKSVFVSVLLPIITIAALLVILKVIFFATPEPGPVDPPGEGNTAHTKGETGIDSGEGDTADRSAEIVEIPDPVLKKVIQEALGIGNREITKADALSLTELRYTGITWEFGREKDKIKDITGLSAFKNLTELELKSNQLSDISALSGLINLTNLHLDNNQLSDISTLSRLTKLETLGLGDNQLNDISTLSGLTSLKSLYLSGNPVLEDKSREEIMEILSGAKDLTDVDF